MIEPAARIDDTAAAVREVKMESAWAVVEALRLKVLLLRLAFKLLVNCCRVLLLDTFLTRLENTNRFEGNAMSLDADGLLFAMTG